MKGITATLFAVAMGFLEAAVVIYLRELIYPEGFSFPLQPIPPDIIFTEIFREAATLIMLAVIGYMLGKNITERFAWFIFCFAVWDIFYYIFLKIILGWPESFMTWDVLFMIPVQWTGPVLAPLITSLSMIFLAYILICFSDRIKIKIRWWEWTGFITGAVIIFLAFTWDFMKFMLQYFSFLEILFPGENKLLLETSLNYIPGQFPWFLFIPGQSIIIISTVFLWRRMNQLRDDQKQKT